MCRIYTKYPFIKQTGFSGVYSDDNNFAAVLEYDKTIARVTTFSVEVNGWGMRRFAVMGSLGTVEIKPIELDVKMTKSARYQSRTTHMQTYMKILKSATYQTHAILKRQWIKLSRISAVST